ncbi:MAG TPA: glycosyltransferase [Vicinamibacterales bacterium]|nr:glycosyltransferase [Vicinamibacterales bacterium]
MAQLPFFVLSPSTILSLTGFIHGPDRTTPTPAEDWRKATVDVIIPALNEAENIVHCLASVARQTVRPRRIVLVDDGSTDGTIARAKAFCKSRRIELVAIQRRSPIGKTPTIKRQAREFDSDVEFILDADTVLESPTYIQRTVQELYQGVGIASAFGTVLPQTRRDRARIAESAAVRAFNRTHPLPARLRKGGWLRDARRGVTNLYREVLYLFLQRFVYRGQMKFFGTTTNPVGCAVAYRRKYVQAMFDHIGPILGDDLTNSEDIFIGFAMLNEGYRNVQLPDVYATTVEPEVHRLPRQIYLWSSAFLQSCYYFDPLVRSPFRMIKRWYARRRGARLARASRVLASGTQVSRPLFGTPLLAGAGNTSPLMRVLTMNVTELPAFVSGRPDRAERAVGGSSTAFDQRRVREAYRQPFGRARTLEYGRPAGWILVMSAAEKVFFPTTLCIMAILHNWFGVALTVAVETLLCVTALAAVMKGRRLEYVVKGLAITPIRYGLLGSELWTIGRFACDLWISGNRKWRK